MHAEKGTIGGWIIGPTTLTSDSVEGKALVLSAKGANRISIGTITKDESGDVTGSTGNAFQVSSGGYMTATGATLYSATIYGTITTSNIKATGGTIGGWSISAGSISAGGTTLSSSGKITCNDLYCYRINGQAVDIHNLSVCTGYSGGYNSVTHRCGGSQTITVPKGGGTFTIDGSNFTYVSKKFKLGISTM